MEYGHNDLYSVTLCVEWDVKPYYTVYLYIASVTSKQAPKAHAFGL